MEKENVEKIMEEYKSGLQNLESKDNENNVEMNRMKLHIERLKEQRDEVDVISEKSLYNEYTEYIKKAEKELEDFKVSIAKTPDTKKQEEILKMDVKNKAIKELTMKGMEIDSKIKSTELELKVVLDLMANFKYEYDENHHALNGADYRALNEKVEQIKEEIYNLKDAKTECEKYLEELKQPSKEVEAINSILNETYNQEKVEPEKTELEKSEPEKSEPEKSEPVKPEPLKSESAKSEPVKPELKPTIEIKEIKITAYNKKEKITKPTLEYKTIDGQLFRKNTQYEFKKDEKNDVRKNAIKNALHETYPDLDFESDDGKKELAKFSKADPNIVALLKNNRKRLEEYAALLNEEKQFDPNDENALKIEYDISKLSKSKISKEAKKNLENYAYEHRNIATVKKNVFQTIKFAFRGFKERISNSKERKALGSGITPAPLKEDDGISNETKETLEKMMADKKEKEKNINEMDKYILSDSEKEELEEKIKRYRELADKINDNFDKETETNNKSTIDTLKEKLENEADPIKRKGLEEMIKTAEENEKKKSEDIEH